MRAVIAAALAVIALAAQARDLDGQYTANPSPLGDWIKGLTVPETVYGGGGLCCSIADGKWVDAEITRDGRWQITYEGKKYLIAPEIVLKHDVSPTEQGLLFVWPVGANPPEFRCFVAPLSGS